MAACISCARLRGEVARMNNQEGSPQREGQEGKPLLLIVDDHPAQRKLFSLLVENLGISAHIVSSCEEALQAMETRKYDLVLMDWQMPEIDGLACAGIIREKESESGLRTPIIAVTAHVLSGDREACLKAGMDDYLGKPFTVKELKSMIARWSQPRVPGAVPGETERVS
jgi:CheY-like chemotaxis protein